MLFVPLFICGRVYFKSTRWDSDIPGKKLARKRGMEKWYYGCHQLSGWYLGSFFTSFSFCLTFQKHGKDQTIVLSLIHFIDINLQHISDSTQLLQPTGLTRNHSMVVPSMTTPKMTSGSTLRLRKPARLTRQFTLPQIFAPTNKFAAPLAVITPRIYRIGRAASYHSNSFLFLFICLLVFLWCFIIHNSIFFVKGTTQRKQKVVSVREGPSQLLSKSRSLPEILIWLLLFL